MKESTKGAEGGVEVSKKRMAVAVDGIEKEDKDEGAPRGGRVRSSVERHRWLHFEGMRDRRVKRGS